MQTLNSILALTNSTQFDVVMLIMRVVVGPSIFIHGYNKMFRAGKIPGTAGWFDSMGMKPNGTVHAYMASLTEMGTGVLLLVGLLSPLAAAGLMSTMLVAGWTVHRKAFLITKNGYEHVLQLAAAAFAIGALGPGTWSLDEVFGLNETFYDGWLGFGLTVGIGIGAGLLLLLACYRPPAKQD